MTLRPVLFRWQEVDVCTDGGEVHRMAGMFPHARFLMLCSRQFAVNEDYPLGSVEGVPSRSRGGFFAAIREAWNNLPEDDARFPTSEHLRKRALVQSGWATHVGYDMDTPADARKLAVALRKADEYAIIKVKGNTVDFWTAKSIAAGAISGEQWRGVKTKALDWVASLAGVTRAALEQHSEDGGAR